MKAPTFRFYKHPLAEKETYVSLAPPYHPSLSKYILLKSTCSFWYSLLTLSADLLCILHCFWSAALPHCPLQPILIFFSCHTDSPPFLTSRALYLFLLQQQPNHLCFSALYRFATCRGFPCVSGLQLQFPFLSYFLLLFTCQHSPWFSELPLCMPPLCMPPHAMLS